MATHKTLLYDTNRNYELIKAYARAEVLQMWQHSNLIENPGVPFNSPHFHDWLNGIARNDCNENRIQTSKLNMPATESPKRLTSAAADSRRYPIGRTYLVLLLAKLESQFENCL
uniref:Uncharacterized protein n=1 Tax=Glossina pallidipes TaxID=7398 RepID=A0A1A9ZMY3_GLOPL